MADRLLFLVPAIKRPPETGGELYNLRLAEGLALQWDLTVATFSDLGFTDRTESEYLSCVKRFVEANGPFDVILQDTYVYPFSKAANAYLAAKAPLIGFGQAVYSERYKRSWVRWRENRKLATCFAQYAGMIVVSEAMRTHALHQGVYNDRLRVILPGFELRSQIPGIIARAMDPIRIITAGSYQPSKGQHFVFEGFRQLVSEHPELRSRLRLEMHGNLGYAPEYVERLRTSVVQTKFDDIVEIGGPIPQAELWDRFAQSHIFAFVAEGEGVGMVTLESMLSGCVPLLTDDELSRELTGNVVGERVSVSANGVAEGLRKLVDRFDRWESEAIASRKQAATLAPTWESTIQNFTDSIKQLSKSKITPR